jgi:XTP/dITP diphosphohydrolase
VIPDGGHVAGGISQGLEGATQHVEHGELRGSLLREPRGAGGFGYDPIFVPADYLHSTAELSAADKNRISHRGQAFRALAPLLATV